MTIGTVFDKNAGFAAGQSQVLGFGNDTGIDSKTYGAPGAKIFYVDPNNPQAVDLGNLGEDPTVPLATVQAAVNLCRDHQGDTIVVGGNDAWVYSPGNRPTPVVESLVIPFTKGGIRLLGAASNPMGVLWLPEDDNDACITVRAVDVYIEGFAFDATTTANNAGIVSEYGTGKYGDNLTVVNCYFSDDLDIGIGLDFAWYCHIRNCYFDDVAVGAIVNLNVTGNPDYLTVTGCQFMNAALALSLLDSDWCFIHSNLLYGDPAGTNNFIDLTGATTCLVTDNYLACSIAQYDVTCSDATSGAWVNNHCINGDTTANPV